MSDWRDLRDEVLQNPRTRPDKDGRLMHHKLARGHAGDCRFGGAPADRERALAALDAMDARAVASGRYEGESYRILRAFIESRPDTGLCPTCGEWLGRGKGCETCSEFAQESGWNESRPDTGAPADREQALADLETLGQHQRLVTDTDFNAAFNRLRTFIESRPDTETLAAELRAQGYYVATPDDPANDAMRAECEALRAKVEQLTDELMRWPDSRPALEAKVEQLTEALHEARPYVDAANTNAGPADALLAKIDALGASA